MSRRSEIDTGYHIEPAEGEDAEIDGRDELEREYERIAREEA